MKKKQGIIFVKRKVSNWQLIIEVNKQLGKIN